MEPGNIKSWQISSVKCLCRRRFVWSMSSMASINHPTIWPVRSVKFNRLMDSLGLLFSCFYLRKLIFLIRMAGTPLCIHASCAWLNSYCGHATKDTITAVAAAITTMKWMNLLCIMQRHWIGFELAFGRRPGDVRSSSRPWADVKSKCVKRNKAHRWRDRRQQRLCSRPRKR